MRTSSRRWAARLSLGYLSQASLRENSILDRIVVCVGMKLQGELVHLEVDWYRVVQPNVHPAIRGVHTQLDFVFAGGNIEFLSLLVDIVANIVHALLRIARQSKLCFGFDGVFELVVRKIRWNDFHGD